MLLELTPILGAKSVLESKGPSVSEWMTATNPTIGPNAPLLEALLVMLSQNVRSLPVVDEERRPVGLLTHVELMQSLARLELRGIERARVLDVMAREFTTVSEYERVSVIAQQFRNERCQCALVVNRAGQLVGTLDESDFVRAVVERRGL